MPTKSESARINGAKSRGPKTEAGRQRSSQNALKHGLTAQTLVLPTEDPEEFNQLLTAYLDQFQPDGPAELHLVHEMVAAKWRLQRLAIIETQLYVEYMERAQEDADDPLSPIESLTSAFTGLANSNSYPFLHRVEARLERTYSRALRNLIQLQRLRQSTGKSTAAPTPSENKICTNEPTEPVQPNGHFTLNPSIPAEQSSVPPPAALNRYASPESIPSPADKLRSGKIPPDGHANQRRNLDVCPALAR
ncbi:MAG TPA: hypothetical protein VMH05_20770 [Bryobacteraceae bacterium]|nr:hypothetical protein [Bryobacteraceae bacterium]